MEHEIIMSKLCDLTNDFLSKNLDLTNKNIARKALHIILSESIQATNYVILIEDEFEIEFEDEEIDMDFFISLDHIASILKQHIINKTFKY